MFLICKKKIIIFKLKRIAPLSAFTVQRQMIPTCFIPFSKNHKNSTFTAFSCKEGENVLATQQAAAFLLF